MKEVDKPKQGTIAVWGGEKSAHWEGATQVPIVQSVAFGYSDLDEWLNVGQGKAVGHIYSRNTNPTVAVFEEKIRMLEGAPASVGFASGMAAISNTLFAMLTPGDRIVSIKDSYGGTNKIFTEFLPHFNIEVVLCETADAEEIQSAIRSGCKLVYLESPTNPTIKILDIVRLSRTAKNSGAMTVVDNTFATPINQNPLQLGADLVIHSATKYLGGHADALGGAVCGDQELVEKIFHFREINGAAMDPTAAYLLLRGMKTLHLRIEKQNRNALQIATYLDQHSKISHVSYPGLESHPQHETAVNQMKGFGGMLAFEVVGGYESVKKMLPELNYAHRAANLGAVETIVGPPATTSHVECSSEERLAMGIPEALVRYSTGIEDAEDLIADLAQALSQI